MGRPQDRSTFETGVRLALLEGDMDRIEVKIDELNDRMGKVLWAILGLLISVTTTCIVLLITAGVGR